MTDSHNKANGQKDGNRQVPSAQGGSSSSVGSNKTTGGHINGESSVVEKAQDAGKGLATQSMAAFKDRAFSSFDSQRTGLAAGLHTLAGSIQETGSSFRRAEGDSAITSVGADFAEGFATKVESLSGYLEKQNFTQMGRDLKGFARRNPGAFVGGALLLGIVASRFLRTGSRSSDHASQMN